jgi:hypothetical protein
MARIALEDGQVITITEADLPIAEPDPDMRYTVRLMSEATYVAMQKACSKRVPNGRGGFDTRVDADAFSRAQIDHVLVDWAGFVEADGAGGWRPVPVSVDNKMKLDPIVRALLIDYAMRNQRTEAQAQADSFRAATDVRANVG